MRWCSTTFADHLLRHRADRHPVSAALEALTGEKISVGAPFFNLTFGPSVVPLLLVVPIGQSLAWKRGDLLGAAQRLVSRPLGLVRRSCSLAVAAWRPGAGAGRRRARGLPVIGAFAERLRRTRDGVHARSADRPARLGLPRSAWGTALAHAGLGVTVLGLAATGWGVERIASIRPGESIDLGPFEVAIGAPAQRIGPNYSEVTGHDADPARPACWSRRSIPPSARFRSGR